MVIGDRLRDLREQKKFSQGDVEKSTVLAHRDPEKLARALEVPMYQLFYDGTKPRCPICSPGSPPTTSLGVVRVRMRSF
jgi:transcriptional regulator with XRE-family HTH domain